MVKILAFDTETSDRAPYIPGTTTWENSKKLLSIKDLKKKNSMWSSLLVKWPHIIQLAYILYDTDHPATKTKIFNKYIDIDDDVIISDESLAIHHISKDKISSVEANSRAKIQDALKEFLKDVKKADVIVGHNVAFDRRMIVAELLRLTKDTKTDEDIIDKKIVTMMKDKKFKCTQEITKPLCKLKIMSSKECHQYKTPKLIESYEHFFGCIPKLEMLHDALIDTIITLRVYCISLKIDPFDINHTNKIITSYINKISPAKCKTFNKTINKKNRNPKGKKTRKNLGLI
jgi:DNA polymerase III epsilon subunit-like protein